MVSVKLEILQNIDQDIVRVQGQRLRSYTNFDKRRIQESSCLLEEPSGSG
jgi:hypothetical protein